jgi:hypothetical protein
MPGIGDQQGIGFGVSAALVASVSTTVAQFGAIASGTVGNTVTETSLIGTVNGSTTLAANAMAVGKTLLILGWGNIGSTLTPTLRIQVKIGGVTVLDTTAAALVAITGTNMWQLTVLITCRTAGAGGTAIAQGIFSYFSAANAQQNQQMVNTGTFAINTTITNLVEVTATWGTADPLNTMTSTNLSALRLG